MLETINIPVIKIATEMLRKYLVEYHPCIQCKKRIAEERAEIEGWIDADDLERELGIKQRKLSKA